MPSTVCSHKFVIVIERMKLFGDDKLNVVGDSA
jgi:hypothetical protein